MLLHSLLVSEEKTYLAVPDVLEGVLTLEEYQARRGPAFTSPPPHPSPLNST